MTSPMYNDCVQGPTALETRRPLLTEPLLTCADINCNGRQPTEGSDLQHA